jgi:hypothetical protein
MGAAKVSWATVGIDKEMVEGVGPPPLLLGHLFGLVDARVSGRARAVSSAVVPGVECRGRRPPCLEPRDWIEEIGVVAVIAVVAAEVFPPQP